MKIFPFAILLLSLSLFAHSQNMSVKSFKYLENDMDARIHFSKKDLNGDVCAIIKVVTPETGFSWDVGSLGVVSAERKTGEYWLYVPWGVKAITIKHDKFGVLRNYVLPVPVEKACVYEMVLVTARLTTIVEEIEIPTQWVIITSEPSGANVYINDQHKGVTPFQGEMEEGKYNYRIQMPLYKNKAGVFDLVEADGRKELSFTLEPDFGFIQVNTTPESGAKVTINGQLLTQTTPVKSDRLKTGTYTVKVDKQLYYPAEKEITVGNGQTEEALFELKPAFGHISVKSTPAGAAVSLNGKPTGKTTPCKLEKLSSGSYDVSVSKEWYHTHNETVTVNDGETAQVSATLKASFGGLTLNTAPEQGARVLLDGNPTNKITPCTLEKLSSGTHDLTFQKEWFEPQTKRITIAEGESQTINVDLKPTFGTLTLTTEPKAKIYIDNEYKASGKWEGRLIAGWHTIEARKEKHTTDKKKLEIVVAKEHNLSLHPTAQSGDLKVVTNPFDATIYLNGENKGTTPQNIKGLMVGEYTVKLQKTGYGTITKTITIKENETVEINENLPSGMEVSITSNPAGAELYIDETKVGSTPYHAALSFGSHKLQFVNGRKTVEETIAVTQGGKSRWQFNVSEDEGIIVNGVLLDTRDNQKYKIVTIGNQLWMAENLNYNTGSGCWCYDNNSRNCDLYGRLYNWKTAKKVCPSGWHLPSKSEVETLLSNYGGEGKRAFKSLMQKEGSDFSALLGGKRDVNGRFRYFGAYGYFWSSSEYDSRSAWFLDMIGDYKKARMSSYYKSVGRSVRCLQD